MASTATDPVYVRMYHTIGTHVSDFVDGFEEHDGNHALLTSYIDKYRNERSDVHKKAKKHFSDSRWWYNFWKLILRGGILITTLIVALSFWKFIGISLAWTILLAISLFLVSVCTTWALLGIWSEISGGARQSAKNLHDTHPIINGLLFHGVAATER